MHADLLVYLAHLLFWGAIGFTRWIITRSGNHSLSVEPDPAAATTRTAPYSRALLIFHALAFGIMYFGLGNAVLPDRVPLLFGGQRVVATLTIAFGAFLVCWAMLSFNSWRFRAKLEEGHQLATGGPFRFVRHPIYVGLNLLALGTAFWVPTPILGVSLLLMLVGSDLRARAEEKLLKEVFGAAYLDYSRRTARFLPAIY